MIEETDFLKAFPEIEDIFEDHLEVYSKWILPLCSIDLNYINPTWQGKIYVVYFNNDPYNEDPALLASYNDYCDDYSMSFRLENGKYQLLTSFDFFKLSDEWLEWHEKGVESYKCTKERFKALGILNPYSDDEGYAIADNIGQAPEWLQTEQVPVDPDGNPMAFIAQVESANYVNDYCEETIYVFYSAKHNLVVQIGQIT